MAVVGTGVDAKSLQHVGAERVPLQHAADGVGHGERRVEILRPLKEYRDIFAGLILMGVIIYLPRGLVTLAELRKTRRLQEIGAADVA